jgi:hypothetical protein
MPQPWFYDFEKLNWEILELKHYLFHSVFVYHFFK